MTQSTSDTQNPKANNALSDLNGAVENPPAWLTDALSVPREEGTLEVDGCDMHYFRWGDRSKPSILMMHGFLAHARCFAFIAPFLAKDYHIVAYDHSGMGDSGTRDAYPEEVRINEMMQVAEQTGLFENGNKPTIIAHSYGSHVAVAASHAHPNRFAGLMVCDLMVIRPEVLKANAANFSPPGNQNANKPNKVYPHFQTAKQRFVLAPRQAVEQAVLLDFMAFHSLKQVEGGWSWKFDPSVFNREQNYKSKWLETGQQIVTAPIRKAIIYGKESILFNADSAAYIEELIEELNTDSVPIIEIPHARHHLMLDQPIAFVTALRTILSLWESH